MSFKLSPQFLPDLGRVCEALQPRRLSAAFLTDLKTAYVPVSAQSNISLESLATRFQQWRQVIQQFLRVGLKELDKDDPLLCPISLFRTMDFGRLETAHTRTLGWLLNPDGEHGFGDRPLAALLRLLPGGDRPGRLEEVRVQCELRIDGHGAEGRLDVVAEGRWKGEDQDAWVLVIEAKVDALEGEGQLDKYDEWLRRHRPDREQYRIFLTVDGREPESGYEEWTALSFQQLVHAFQIAGRDLKDAPGFHFLRFYLAGVLQDICGWPRTITADATDPYVVAFYLKQSPNRMGRSKR